MAAQADAAVLRDDLVRIAEPGGLAHQVRVVAGGAGEGVGHILAHAPTGRTVC